MQNFISRLIRFVLKLVLAAFGLVFAVSLLLAALVVVAISLVKWLITGKKPAPVVIFNKFQKFSPGGIWPGATRSKTTADVEVREVRPTHQQLKSDSPPP
jgi:hypothetical protein